jgi:hypothetical protein
MKLDTPTEKIEKGIRWKSEHRYGKGLWEDREDERRLSHKFAYVQISIDDDENKFFIFHMEWGN